MEEYPVFSLTNKLSIRYMEGHGKSHESAPPVPDHNSLPNQGAAYKSSILSLTAPTPAPKIHPSSVDLKVAPPIPSSLFAYALRYDKQKHERFLQCGSVDELRVGELQQLLSAFKVTCGITHGIDT